MPLTPQDFQPLLNQGGAFANAKIALSASRVASGAAVVAKTSINPTNVAEIWAQLKAHNLKPAGANLQNDLAHVLRGFEIAGDETRISLVVSSDTDWKIHGTPPAFRAECTNDPCLDGEGKECKGGGMRGCCMEDAAPSLDPAVAVQQINDAAKVKRQKDNFNGPITFYFDAAKNKLIIASLRPAPPAPPAPPPA
jgi:hypothetical protein